MYTTIESRQLAILALELVANKLHRMNSFCEWFMLCLQSFLVECPFIFVIF